MMKEDFMIEGHDPGHRDSDVSTSTISRNSTSTDNEIRAALRERSKHSLSAKNSVNEDLENNKITGYLEKRSKMLGWKQFWFVLDGRLLTYYKSKSDYENLQAFNGSINLGIATNVSPIKSSKGFPFQIVTRTQVYYLRAAEKPQLDLWLIAIQEAATIPPNISNPIWVDPGIQFYRYSFKSTSQWSLSASTDDLTNDHRQNSHQNFIRPTSLLKKCHSFAALNFSSSKSSTPFFNSKSSKNNYYTNYYSNNNNTDFHNNSKNEPPFINSTTSTTNLSSISSTNNKNPNSLDFESATLPRPSSGSREMQEIIAPKNHRHKGFFNNNKLHKMRHTTSMMALESSPQAAELRRELARRSSIPTSSQTQNNSSVSDASTSSKNEANNKVPQKPDRKEKENVHAYSNYQNSEVYHDYDEIMELDKGIYEPCGDNSQSDDKNQKRPESIYENVENPMATNSSLNNNANTPSPVKSPIAGDPWEKLPPNSAIVASHHKVSQMLVDGPPSSSNRNIHRRSLQQRESSGRNSLVSIAEMPEKENFPSSYPSLPHHYHGHSHSWDKSSEKDSDTNSTTSSGGTSKKKKNKKISVSKRSSISGFFHKIFHKDKKGKEELENNRERGLVITGPVDLRRRQFTDDAPAHSQMSKSLSKRQSSPAGSSSTLPNYGSNSNSNRNSGSASNLNTIIPSVGSHLTLHSSDNLLAELNQKIGQMKRSSTSSLSEQSQPVTSRDRFLGRKSRSHSETIEEEDISAGMGLGFGISSRNHQRQASDSSKSNPGSNRSSSISYSGGSLSRSRSGSGSVASGVGGDETSQINAGSTHTLQAFGQSLEQLETSSSRFSKTDSESEEFRKKLERFNRLSASLNPSFVAALSHSYSYTCNPSSSLAHININSNSPATRMIGRSHSWRVRGSEEPPLLPPKRKQCFAFPVYDVPQNNTPIPSFSSIPSELSPNDEGKTLQSTLKMNPDTGKSAGSGCELTDSRAGNSSTLSSQQQQQRTPLQLPFSRNMLTKKHSAPDISFGRSPIPSLVSDVEQTSLLMQNLVESTDEIFQDEISSIPPPRPPPPVKNKQESLPIEREEKIESDKNSCVNPSFSSPLSSPASSSSTNKCPPIPPPRPPKPARLSSSSCSSPVRAAPLPDLPVPELEPEKTNPFPNDDDEKEINLETKVEQPSSILLSPPETPEKSYVNWTLREKAEKTKIEEETIEEKIENFVVATTVTAIFDEPHQTALEVEIMRIMPKDETEEKEQETSKNEDIEISEGSEASESKLEESITIDDGKDKELLISEPTLAECTGKFNGEQVEVKKEKTAVENDDGVDVQAEVKEKVVLVEENLISIDEKENEIESNNKEEINIENRLQIQSELVIEIKPDCHEQEEGQKQVENIVVNQIENEPLEESPLIQLVEILESPTTTALASPIPDTVQEREKSKFMKMCEAPVRHQVEILEIPPLVSLQSQSQTKGEKPKLKAKPVSKLNFNLNKKIDQQQTEQEKEELSQIPAKLSPTLSTNSADIDNLEILSDLSDGISSLPESPLGIGIINPPNIVITIKSPPSSPNAATSEPNTNTNHPLASISPNSNEAQVKVEESVSSPKQTESENKNCSLDENDDKFDDGSHFYDDVPFEDVSLQAENKFQLQFATFSTVPWETVTEETEEEIYEKYDDFPVDTFPSPASATMTTVLPTGAMSGYVHQSIRTEDSIRNSGIDQLQAYLSENSEDAGQDKLSTGRPGKPIKSSINRLGYSSAIEQLKQLVGNDENN